MPVRDDSVREEIMQAGGAPLRVAIRPGTGTGPPLLLCNGIGMRLEALRPFVDALDPAIEVIRFDAPGVGGSQLPNLKAEFSSEPFVRGTIGMARTQDPNSANSQFFICFDDASFLNGKYTVVGQVISGMDVVDKIKKGSSEANGAVSDPDKIMTLRMANAKPVK